MKVLIADGSAVYKKVFGQAAAEAGKDVVVSYASDWSETVDKIQRNDYDIVVLDADILKAGADTLLKEMARELPKAVVMVTARPSSANRALFAEVFGKGVADCMTKPIYDSYGDNLAAVKSKMSDIFKITRGYRDEKEKRRPPEPMNRTNRRRIGFYPEIALIAASTGGPPALENIMSALSGSFPAPILVVQHTLPVFTTTLARQLDKKSELKIKVAETDEPVEPGTVYIAPGGQHMKLDANKKIFFEDSPLLNGVRPAADALFDSVASARSWTGVLAVILTGMGRDGEKGLVSLKEKQNCFCLAQSERTCVIYGMPRAAVESGLADIVLDLNDIPREMESFSFSSGA